MDNVTCVCYITGTKGWLDRRVMKEWVLERRDLPPLTYQRRTVLFMEKYGGHKVTEDLLEALNVANNELRFFPTNETYLLQPADSFVIQKIKVWNKRWE